MSERRRNGGLDEIPLPSGHGRMWLCGKHLVGPDPEAALSRAGADVIVCLNPVGELASRYPAYVEWLRAHNGGRAMWVPVHDMHALDVAELTPVVNDVRAHLDAGFGVIVHCGAGIGRAGTLAAAVLASMGMPVENALAHLRAHRSMAGPQTRDQEDALANYAASLR